jgi:hypothetical protein
MTKNLGVLAATAFAIVIFALIPGSAAAQSYSGSYSLTWDITSGFTGTHTYCLTLTDNGTGGFPHSGPATATGNYVIDPSSEGSFAVINNELEVTFSIPSGGEEGIGSLTFVGPAHNGAIASGFGQYFAEGAFTDLGPLTVGKAGSCGDKAENDGAESKKQEQPRSGSSDKKG